MEGLDSRIRQRWDDCRLRDRCRERFTMNPADHHVFSLLRITSTTRFPALHLTTFIPPPGWMYTAKGSLPTLLHANRRYDLTSDPALERRAPKRAGSAACVPLSIRHHQ